MADQISNYQCPACTGPLRYDGKLGKLQCDYCGTSFTVQEIEALYKEKDEKAAAASAQAREKEDDGAAGWTQGLRAYNCPSCGAELICDANTAATSCPYCGNPSIIPGQLSEMLKPDYVIPFRLSKEDAIAALKNYYRGKVLLPKPFTRENHIEEIQGVYVPFWLYDGTADAEMGFQATRSMSVTTGNTITTTTEYYNVHRAGTVHFEKIPVDASSKMPDAHMDAIEPYDYSELKPFSTAYLPGFLADKYDLGPDACSERAETRAENTTADLMAQTVAGYDTVIPTNKRVSVRRGKPRYALLPVWMLSTRWAGENYLFAMNGQTGKLVGDLPVSNGRAAAWFCGLTCGLTALFSAILYLL